MVEVLPASPTKVTDFFGFLMEEVLRADLRADLRTDLAGTARVKSGRGMLVDL